MTRPTGTEPFVVRHYTEDPFPSIKGNGFDGLQVGEDREEAEEFIAWINKRICHPANFDFHPTPGEIAAMLLLLADWVESLEPNRTGQQAADRARTMADELENQS